MSDLLHYNIWMSCLVLAILFGACTGFMLKQEINEVFRNSFAILLQNLCSCTSDKEIVDLTLG